MRNIADTIARMASMKARGRFPFEAPGAGRLAALSSFGSNPGDLAAKTYIPKKMADGAALVVVLHGCTQTAEGYDRGSGWSALAEREGFAVLYAEQQRSNNANLCFNWFVPSDTRRDSGEALSIRQMTDAVASAHGIDRGRIFVTGLSAGGAMAGAMLASYPEVFAGGAIIAGLPYGSAATIPQAFDRMRGSGGPDIRALQAKLREASDHSGPWPTVSIWHGDADATVSASNAESIAGQWRKVHKVGAKPSRVETVDGHRRRIWCDGQGREVVESFTISGMGHGTPLDPGGAGSCGATGPYMIDAGISSTEHIARFWGIAATVKAARRRTQTQARTDVAPSGYERSATGRARPGGARPAQGTATKVARVIEDALRAAGLLR